MTSRYPYRDDTRDYPRAAAAVGEAWRKLYGDDPVWHGRVTIVGSSFSVNSLFIANVLRELNCAFAWNVGGFTGPLVVIIADDVSEKRARSYFAELGYRGAIRFIWEPELASIIRGILYTADST